MAKQDDKAMLNVSRRDLATLVTGGVALAALPRQVGAATGSPLWSAGHPVVGFHNDAPWLDLSGRAAPYHPPTATGRFAPDSESLMRLGFFL